MIRESRKPFSCESSNGGIVSIDMPKRSSGSTLARGSIPIPKDASFFSKTAARFLAKSFTRSSMARSSSGLASSITPTTPLIAQSPPSTAPTASPTPPIFKPPLPAVSRVQSATRRKARSTRFPSANPPPLPASTSRTPTTLAYNRTNSRPPPPLATPSTSRTATPIL